MNDHDNARLAYGQLLAGLDYGKKIADLVIKQFPHGFSEQLDAEITVIVDKALAVVTQELAANDVAKTFRDSFENGFYISARKQFSEYANDCAARCVEVTTVG